jgi:hypothetical protein
MTNDLIEQLLSDAEAFTSDFNSVALPGPLANKRADRLRQAAAHIEALAERVRELEGALEEKRRDGFLTTWTIIRAAGGQVLVSDSVAADFAPDRAILHREEDPESGGVIMRATLSARQARKDKEEKGDG